MLDILKEYGLYYVHVDLKTGQRTEFVKGSYEDIKKAFLEIVRLGLMPAH